MPLPISEVDLTVNAAGVKTSRPIAWLSLSGVGLSARVTEDRTSTLRVVGTVQLGHDLVEMAKRGKSEEGAPHPQGARSPSLADHVWVHLQLTGPPDGVTVDVPKVPDVILGAHCTIEGPLSSPRIFGEVKGDNLYSRVALAVADWFNPRNLRKCDLGPRPQSP
jgi:hypothetical protein